MAEGATSPAIARSAESVIGRRGFLAADLKPGYGALLIYVAIGALIVEGAAGIALYTNKPGPTATVAPGPTVPNGPPVTFTLKAFLSGYIGVGGSINGMKDPTLTVQLGDHVTILLTDGENMMHNLYIDGYNVQSGWVQTVGANTSVSFWASNEGSFDYYCTNAGHRAEGMQGTLIVGEASGPQIGPEANLSVASISQSPTAIPPPIERNFSTTVNIYLHAVEVTAEIEKGVSFNYWTYNGTVPGPFFRVRVGDTVVVHFSNDKNDMMNHSVDFHAVTGPGGGASVTQTVPGGMKNFSFLAMTPGLFVYHCGSPNIPTHISNGMFGMILVEPQGGLPKVDHEFYLMQNELYLTWPIHSMGNQLFNGSAILANDPTYVVFNGAYRALTGTHALQVKVNESVRIFFGDAGPDSFSAFHLIGSMFDRSYLYGDLTDPPMANLQTVPVPPGSTAMMEYTPMYPGNYTFVDHQIANALDKGALAVISVTGWANSSIFHAGSVSPAVVVASSSFGGAGARRAE